MRQLLVFLSLLLVLNGNASFAAGVTHVEYPRGVIDRAPRVAIISAFEPELATLLKSLSGKRSYRMNGVEFTTGTLRGKRVVLFLSGISMVNAAMNTQLVLDRFNVTHIVFSGIAGGVNPALNVGDVVVAERWAQYLEILAAREVSPDKFVAPAWMDDVKLPNFGMMHPRPVGVRSKGRAREEKKFWFEADAKLLAAARALGDVPLADCDEKKVCLTTKPKLLVGGNGVSGQAFVDNAAFRECTFKTFNASVLDMETSALAMVAYANGVPYIAFRSLSDLAGGGKGENEIETFFKLAADNSARVLMAFLAAWK
jgi:adenosylhomocysteine nucleosidase